MASRRLKEFPDGLYAHWLDGEWLKCAYPIAIEGTGETLADIATAGLKLHALFGTRIAISDIQLTDSDGIVRAFADPGFREYLKTDPNFITLISSPPKGVTDSDHARVTTGLYRACSQPHWRTSLRGVPEEVIKSFGDEILSNEETSPARDLSRTTKGPGAIIARHPEFRVPLEGILYGVHFFANGSGQLALQPDNSRSYVSWIEQFLNTPGIGEHYNAFEGVYDSITEWVPDEAKRYARSSLSTALESKEPERSKWPVQYHRLWQTAVHAWNSNVRENLGVAKSSILPLPYALVGDRSIVTDAAGPFRLSDELVRNRFESSLFTFNPIEISWTVIRNVRREHQDLQEKFQAALLRSDADECETKRSLLIRKMNSRIAPGVKAEWRDTFWATTGLVGLVALTSLSVYVATAFTVMGAVGGADYLQRLARNKQKTTALCNTLDTFSRELVPRND